MKPICAILFALSSLQSAIAADVPPKRAKNVILFLADAGGIATVNAASILGHNAPQKLFVQSWPHIALSDTSPVSRWVTDSAAGMTAIVTGEKTHNGVISQGADTVRGKTDGAPLKTILEYAEERGLSTGVISNVNIADATPAACYAHANDRKKFADIFFEIFNPRFGDGVDIVLGRGRKQIAASIQAAGKDMDAEAVRHGRPIYASLSEVPEGALRAISVFDNEVDLEAAVKIALGALSQNSKGYFLMVESDAHTDNPMSGLSRLVAFDKLIRQIAGVVNLDETLLLFTADHSFDLRIRGGSADEPLLKGLDEWERQDASTRKLGVRLPFLRVDGSHTGEEVLVTATGPGAERVRGFLPNTQIFQIMMDAYGWTKNSASSTTESGLRGPGRDLTPNLR